jgi:hypothetical protein
MATINLEREVVPECWFACHGRTVLMRLLSPGGQEPLGEVFLREKEARLLYTELGKVLEYATLYKPRLSLFEEAA